MAAVTSLPQPSMKKEQQSSHTWQKEPTILDEETGELDWKKVTIEQY